MAGVGKLGVAVAELAVEVVRLGVEEGKLPAAVAELGWVVPGWCGGAKILAVRVGNDGCLMLLAVGLGGLVPKVACW